MASTRKKLDKMITTIRDKKLDGRGIEMFKQPLPGANKSGEALEIPGYFQTATYTCGYIAGMNVVHTFHPRYPRARFRKKLRMTEEMGADTWPLIKALRSSGVGVSVRRTMTFDDIVTAISEGFPVILMITTSTDGVAHWVVVYGYQRTPESILLAGKGIGLLKQNIIPREKFEQILYIEKDIAGLICWGKPLKQELRVPLKV